MSTVEPNFNTPIKIIRCKVVEQPRSVLVTDIKKLDNSESATFISSDAKIWKYCKHPKLYALKKTCINSIIWLIALTIAMPCALGIVLICIYLSGN